MNAREKEFFLEGEFEEEYSAHMKTCQTILIAACAVFGTCFCGAAGKGGASKKELPDLGRVMFIGDSITHGYGSPSYRWALHKIWVDNGIEFDAVGIETGNNKAAGKGGTSIDPGTMYIGKQFNNKHAAMSSQRAYETSGRTHGSGRLNDTDILDWLGVDKTYNGPRKVGEPAPDTYFILLGTNDTLSDCSDKGGIGKGSNISETSKALLDKKKGDMSVIVDTIRKVNKKARIIVLTIPTWGNTKNNTNPADYAAIVNNYDKQLSKWAKSKKLILADVNKGLIDVANQEKPGKGVPSFYGDGLHPNPQGDLLMAGRVAQAMGVAGRSAGLPRKASAKFDMTAASMFEAASAKEGVELKDDALTFQENTKLEMAWPQNTDLAKGFTVSFVASVGNGQADGWTTDKGLVVQLGNGTASGELLVSESYITWNGGKILYSDDMSKDKEAIRVTYMVGNPDADIPGGFYVWLGEMLVGEALSSDGKKTNGISFSNTGSAKVKVLHAAADGAPSAPAPKGYVKEEVVIEQAVPSGSASK